MAILSVTPIQKSGLADINAALVPADVAGDSYDASSGTFVAVQNADAAPHTLTIIAPVTSAQCGNLGSLPVSDIEFTVAAGDLGVFAIPSGYADIGEYKWSYDDVTSLSVGVFSISP